MANSYKNLGAYLGPLLSQFNTLLELGAKISA